MAGGIRENASDDLAESHEINVTPFIDVMLVLLIIFMVAAPLATVDVNVELPVSTAAQAPRPDEPIYVTLKQDLSLNLNDDLTTSQTLAGDLDALTETDRETRIFLRADKGVAYGDLMDLMNLLRTAGYLKIGLVGLESVAGAPGTEETVAP
ncbi:MAG: TonB system transport protein ExbD [Candidatus Devosia phytovorans]|uniref:Biopolymer transport protein ExbD n=1 Tax=Candidatus Devosia phytovorans TaxID=3121372 RepID=A0AAJ5VU62_9HYPH|nr:TonB system transport protein ExbD [Devosia sp.]WEK03662.1 MAG: TonB system transport protein ExbD [Devosia sp.]